MERATVFIPLLIVLLLFACSSESPGMDAAELHIAVETAIAQTRQAGPVDTAIPQPTGTLKPTQEPTPIPTATPSCDDRIDTYLAELEKIFTEWDDANAIANSTARINLSQPTANLQEIRRRVEDIQPPECDTDPHQLMIQYMDHVIESYLSFMGEDDYLAGVLTEVAKLQLGYFWQAVERGDLPQSDPLVPIDYVVDSLGYRGVRYWDETGKEAGWRPEMPWTYHFDAEPGSLLSVTDQSGGACAILIDGLLNAIYASATASGDATCRGSWYD